MMDRMWQQKQKLLDPEAGAPRRESSFKEDFNALFPSLTYQERLIGCVTCFALGFMISLGSTFRLAKLVRGHPAPFAIAYTIGNLLSLAASMFFVGPCKQMETMFRKKRRGSAVLYILFMVFTIVLCFAHDVPHRIGLVVLSVLCQFLALVWYTLSYIPYGRNMVVTCGKRVCGLATEEDEM